MGVAPVMISECRIDLWQLRSHSTRSPRETMPCQTILLDVDVPPTTKSVSSDPKMRAALRSPAAMGPVWSRSEPRAPTETETSERSVFSPKNS